MSSHTRGNLIEDPAPPSNPGGGKRSCRHHGLSCRRPTRKTVPRLATGSLSPEKFPSPAQLGCPLRTAALDRGDGILGRGATLEGSTVRGAAREGAAAWSDGPLGGVLGHRKQRRAAETAGPNPSGSFVTTDKQPVEMNRRAARADPRAPEGCGLTLPTGALHKYRVPTSVASCRMMHPYRRRRANSVG